MGKLIVGAIGAVLWAAVIVALWSGAANLIAARHDSLLPQVASNEDAKVAAAPNVNQSGPATTSADRVAATNPVL